jgi:hypothetical protein
VEDCDRYGGNDLIQSRLNNTVGYLRRVVLWPAVKVVQVGYVKGQHVWCGCAVFVLIHKPVGHC